MAKQLNVNLAINADVSKAKASIEDLSKSLQAIQATPKRGGLIDDVAVRKAAEAARELQKHISAAVNVDTGKLDLNRFAHSLKSSNKDLKAYYNDLMRIGPAGEQAFLKLSRSISTAETSTIRVNKKLQEFATTLKNTARWQISSSVLHGFMGAIQSAYGYAKDLDSALNDIRIVTNASAESMDNFALKANRAAKELSTSTTEYAKASLIYFQQGLNESQVSERTEITIKMANAAGKSAEIISDQLTAVWNNFYDGSQSLEHYADAMVRLGADTASSSDEIAEGLEKFASIGPMIGLGFDEAAAALATVTAQTRESADVVGTAYKTIFARIQGLNLGKTLEDGTTLNKYSEALAKVGISIKDQFGGIKDMNILLDEMGAKWQNISKDQQIALAQAVGGVRQYNQIVSLMDNYDFYQKNLNAAKNADGSLDVQAAIAAESWEAAEKRVRAAAEGVYDSLLNEDFFIDFDNGLSTLLEGVEGLVDGLGGMTGVLATIGSLIMRHFAKEAPAALKNFRDNINGLLGRETQQSKDVQNQNDEILNQISTDDQNQKSRNAHIKGTQAVNEMNRNLNERLPNLSEEERRAYEEKMKIVAAEYEILEALGKELELEEKKTNELEQQFIKQSAKKKLMEKSKEEAKNKVGKKKDDETDVEYNKRLKEETEKIYRQKHKKSGGTSDAKKELKAIQDQTKALKNNIEQVEKLGRMQENAKNQAKSWEDNADVYKANSDSVETLRSKIQQALSAMKGIDKESLAYEELSELLEDNCDDVDELIAAFKRLSNSEETFAPIEAEIDSLENKIEKAENALIDFGADPDNLNELEENFRSNARANLDFKESMDQTREVVNDLPTHTVKASEALAELGSAFTGLVGLASSAEGLFDVFADDKATAIQKIGASVGFLTSIITAATGVYRALKAAEEAELIVKIKSALANHGFSASAAGAALAQGNLAGAFRASIGPIIASGAELKKHPIMWIPAIIAAVVAAISLLISHLDRVKEKHAEDAAAAKEEADALYEEVQANNELRESFESAVDAYERGVGSKEAIAEATKALCEVYDIENEDLLLAAENYDKLAESIRNAETAKLERAKSSAESAVNTAEVTFKDEMTTGAGHYSGNNYAVKFGGGTRSNDEKIIREALNDMLNSGDLSSDIWKTDWTGNDITLKTGKTTSEMIKAYEEVQEFQRYLESKYDETTLTASENYTNITEWLAKAQETYSDLILLQEQLESVSVQAAKNKVVSQFGEIEDFEQYESALAELTNILVQDSQLKLTTDQATALATEALKTEKAYAEMASEAQIIEQASKATKENISEEELRQFYETLSEEQKPFFATLNFDTAKSIEDLEAQLALLQSRADQATIKTKLEAVQNAQSELKDDMSIDDYKNFKDTSGINWGEDGFVEYADFLKMTYEEQVEYLSGLEDDLANTLETATDTLITESTNRLEELEGTAEAEELLSKAQSTLTQLENDLMSGQAEDSQLLLKAQNLNPASDAYQTDLGVLAEEYGVTPEAIQSYLDAYEEVVSLNAEINTLKNSVNELQDEQEINKILDFAQAREDLIDLKNALAGLEAGGTIDKDQYKVLSENLPNLTENFFKAADGSYQLKAGIDHLNLSWREMQGLSNEDGANYFTTEEIANMITSVNELDAALAAGAITEEDYAMRFAALDDEIMASSLALADSAKTLSELDAAVGAARLDKNDETYTLNLQRIAEGYDSCKDALERYKSALDSFDPSNEESVKLLEAAEDQLRAMISLEEAANKYDLQADSLAAQANEIREATKDVNGEYEISAEQAAALAVTNQRMNKGLAALIDGWKDWKKVLSSTDKTSQDYADALADLSDSVQDLVGWYDDLNLDSKFVEKNMELIEEAATGDTGAIMRLGAEVANMTVAQAELNATFLDSNGNMIDKTSALEEYANSLGEGTTAAEAFANAQAGVQAGFNTIAENMEALQNGASLSEVFGSEGDLEAWVNQLNAYAAATGMTAAQMQQMLSSVGVTANVQSDYQEQEVTVPTYIEHSEPYQTSAPVYEDGPNGEKLLVSPGGWDRRTWTTMGPPVTTTGYVEVASISMDGDGESPGVSPPQFTGKQAPASSVTSPSGSKGSGSPKKGSTPKETKKNEEKRKDPTDEKERYHVIKSQLKDLTAAYDKISGAKDRAFGAARLKAINKEIDAQKKLADANKKYLNEIKGYLDSDKGAVSSAAITVGTEAEFDENGTLLNYDELVEKAVKKYNKAVKEFNKHSTDDESAQKVFEKAQEDYDKFMETLDQYDETRELWLEQMQTVLDDIMTAQSLELEKIQYEVELKINVSDDSLKYLEYVLGNIEDKAYDCAEAFAYLNEMTSIYDQKGETYKKGIYDIFESKGFTEKEIDALVNGDENVYNKAMGKLSNGGQADIDEKTGTFKQSDIDAAYGFTAEDIDAIRENVDGLLETNKSLEDLREQVHDQILIAWDELNQKMDDSISKMEHLQSITQSYQNIIDIVGQKNLGVSDAFMTKMEQQATTQARDKVAATKARKDASEDALKKARATFDAQKDKGILSPEEIKQWEETIRKMEEDTQAAAEAFQAAWEESLTAAQAQFEASVERMIKAYDDAAAGLMGSMAELQEMFDRKSDISKQYLADYEKIYQISKLNRELDKSIDSTTNVKAKQELLELQSKINAYEEAGVQISEYQMEQLRQEYELKKAQIELEESQSAKSEVQMTRDAEGNYSYVYTANDDDVANAEQNYEDKLHAMQESNANYINDLQSNMIQLEQDYQGKVQEIMLDTSLTAEERMSKLNELNEYYDQKMKFYMSEAKLWQENSCRLYEQDWAAYAAATGYKISSEEQWLDHWEETQLAVLTGFGSLEEYYANHNTNVATLLLTSAQNLATWQGNVEEAMKAAGTSVAGFQTTAEKTLGDVATKANEAQTEIAETAKTAMDKMGEVIGAVATWENSYSESISRILLKNKALIKSFNKVIQGWSKYTKETGSGDEEEGDPPKKNNDGDPPKKNKDNGGKPKWSRVVAAFNKINNGAWGNGEATRIARGKADGFTKAEVQAGQKLINYTYDRALGGQGKSREEAKKLMGYDTGGYTGAWGDAVGKLALLHEKEIVLNKDDTANFLKTVEIVRQISDMIDLNAMTSAGGLNSLFAATSSNLTNTLQQEVTIHAEFPNATDKDQITEAFSDLINLASQYANRKL